MDANVIVPPLWNNSLLCKPFAQAVHGIRAGALQIPSWVFRTTDSITDWANPVISAAVAQNVTTNSSHRLDTCGNRSSVDCPYHSIFYRPSQGRIRGEVTKHSPCSVRASRDRHTSRHVPNENVRTCLKRTVHN
jgi:hypothetical protein